MSARRSRRLKAGAASIGISSASGCQIYLIISDHRRRNRGNLGPFRAPFFTF
jgi:hypothetical protein